MQVKAGTAIEYKYFTRHRSEVVEWEFGEPRIIKISGSTKLMDTWRSNHHEQNVLYTSPFKNAFYKSPKTKGGKAVKSPALILNIRAPHIKAGQSLCVVGSSKELGAWDEKKAKVLECTNDVWQITIPKHDEDRNVEYKYGLWDNKEKVFVAYETGSNRNLSVGIEEPLIINDEYFGHPDGNWRGAGVAVPVFSLRTESSYGVGEFRDIIPLVDWAEKTGLKLIQVLPVNDTIATHTWVDSYPYASISVFALHPIYANLSEMGELSDRKKQAEFDQLQVELNKLETVDYEQVLEAKSTFFKLKFDEDKEQVFNDKAYKSFFQKNKKWLVPYAVFSYLRDSNGTADFSKWKKYSKITDKELTTLSDPKSKHYDHVAIHYYIQYHLDKQLSKVTAYARTHDVVLKGDIPIGIYRHSVDAWIAPHLYNMDAQSGAPPDAFSTSGQNWGFPTYNWDEMAKDGYLWWRERLAKMADYFDVFRIDHILGFFRIWEIPWSAVEGTLGSFNPALPVTTNELKSWGIDFNYDRLCRPFIRDYVINDVFGEFASEVTSTYLDQIFPGELQPKVGV